MPKFNHTTGGDTSRGGKYISEDGTYHCVVTAVTDKPTKNNGELYDNVAFAADISVINGTDASQRDKVMTLRFNSPLPSHKDGGAMARKIIDCFFLATSLATQEQLSDGGKEIDVELDEAIGRQFVAKIVMEKSNSTSESGAARYFPKLSFADIYHVDDPAVKAVPKDENALATLDSSLRWIGNKPSSSDKPSSPPLQPASSSEDTDFSDL